MLNSWEIVTLALIQRRAPELFMVNSMKGEASAVLGLLCADLTKRGYCTETPLDYCITGYSLTQLGLDELVPEVVGAVSGVFASIPSDNTRTPIISKQRQDDLALIAAQTIDSLELFVDVGVGLVVKP